MYICTDCGNESVKWKGQCDFCKSWSTMKEFKETKEKSGKMKGETKQLKKIKDIKISENKITVNSKELNNVLGGGLVRASTVLLSGEPGIGKSTLALQLGKWIDSKIIYISGEETEYQLISRANRLKIKGDNFSLLSESKLEDILETLKNNKSDLVIIDSISVIYSENISGVSGSITQVKYITEKLVEFAKNNDTTIIIIGHITKDGSVAGPKTLEHMVDTVLYFEGDKFENLRILRALKNRFGSTSEVGLFKMEEIGLLDLKNPGLEFISSIDSTIGSTLSITVEGSRALIIETESLTTYTKFGYPKRSSTGINSSKLDLIIAVLLKYTNIKLDSSDVYLNIARGLKIGEPGIDLSLAASIISSKTEKVIPKNIIFIGEISLTGQIKNVMYLEKRIKEASKLGFEKIFIPNIEIKGKYKIEIIKIKNISELVKKF